MYSELPVENDSRLKLSNEELKSHYMSHLFLQALGLLKEVSLYLLELGFRHSRQAVDALYKTTWIHNNYFAELVELSSRLPDRFVNGVVLYRLALYRYPNNDAEEKERLFLEAQRLLKEKDETKLTADDHHYLARLCLYMTRTSESHDENTDEAFKYFERASLLGCEESTLVLAMSYKKGYFRRTPDLTKAVHYELKGHEMGNCEMTAYLAESLEKSPSFAPNLSFKELYKISASQGNRLAIMKCAIHNLSY